MIEFKIMGTPFPKLRARFSSKTKCFYNLQQDTEENIRWFLKSQIQEKYKSVYFPLKGPIACDIDFFIKPPASWTKKDNNLLSWGIYNHTSKPDLDNFAKFYIDCMNEIVYEDDRQLYSIYVKKYYSYEPRTEIRIMSNRKSIQEKVKEILSFLSPEEFTELVDDMQKVASCLDIEVLAKEGELKDKMQLEAAYVLSIFADRYGATLNKITKQHPGIWKCISNYEKTILEKQPS
jgi:Holliday junction resolvase RusA-like endonuclease